MNLRERNQSFHSYCLHRNIFTLRLLSLSKALCWNTDLVTTIAETCRINSKAFLNEKQGHCFKDRNLATKQYSYAQHPEEPLLLTKNTNY